MKIDLFQFVSSMGVGPAHLTLDKANSNLYCSNYGGGSFSVYGLNADGSIGDLKFTETFEDAGTGIVPDRQEASHVHGSWVYQDRLVMSTE